MPLSKYYKGKGARVMRDMQSRYGAKKGKSVFYATANKRGEGPTTDDQRSRVKRRKRRKVRHGKGSGHPMTDRIYRRERSKGSNRNTGTAESDPSRPPRSGYRRGR